jgi:hypothetical protein
MAVCVIFVMDHCSNRKTFSSTPQCSTKFLYYDDLEICNPLGSNVKKHKLGAFYYVVGNIEPRYRSALRVIQLVTLVKSKLVDEYGVDEILKPFVESILKLEQGVSFTVGRKEETMTLFGALAVVCADNLAAHLLAGYKSLHRAFRRCRFCMATKDDMTAKVRSM